MTEESRKKLNDYFDSLVVGKKIDFTDEEVNNILANPKLTERILKTMEFSSFGEKESFGPSINEFEFTVSEDYDSDNQINNFVKKAEQYGHPIDSKMSDENFKESSYKFIPGKTYIGKFYPILSVVTGKDCIDFLKERPNTFFAGPKGLTLLTKFADKINLPNGKWIYSFDSEEFLFKEGEEEFAAPALFSNIGLFKIIFNNIKNNLNSEDYLFCVSEKKYREY